MSSTEAEKVEIIDRAVEKTLLMIPEVVGNLLNHHSSLNKINKDFYENHPELREHKEIVASVIESVEGKNPPMDYTKLVDKALPEIKQRISDIKDLDMIKVDVPVLDYNGVF